MKALREILVTLAVAIIIFILLQTTIQSSVVVGSSMQPSLQHRQRLIINKAVYAFRQPEKGEVIVFRSPNR
jgi:signal peptidase I